MKTYVLIAMALTSFSFVHAQEIHKSEVPSIVLNHFNVEFPKATDVEWEKDRDLYRVDFELDWNIDHEIWYDTAGKVTKHLEEIEHSTLPAAVVSRINTDFKEYRIDDAEKMTTANGVLYILELDAFLKEEWEITLDENGAIVSKILD